jgi:hypothetical protein
MKEELGVTSETGEWILPKRLRQGLREALDAGHGRLRMDPQDLAEILGKAIDAEVERLGRIRLRHAEKLRSAAMFRNLEHCFVAGRRATKSMPKKGTALARC